MSIPAYGQPYAHRTTGAAWWREGVATGLIGALVVAAAYLVADIVRGVPFLTPSVLGQILLRHEQPSSTPVVGAVIGFTVLHLVSFALFGLLLVRMATWARRNPIARYGVVQLFVALVLFSYGVLAYISNQTFGLFPFTLVMGANLLAILAMSGWLWIQHPSLRWAVKAYPLGAIDGQDGGNVRRRRPTIVYRF